MPPLVNGVDLPVEFQEAQDDAALNFMGESEVQPPGKNSFIHRSYLVIDTVFKQTQQHWTQVGLEQVFYMWIFKLRVLERFHYLFVSGVTNEVFIMFLCFLIVMEKRYSNGNES